MKKSILFHFRKPTDEINLFDVVLAAIAFENKVTLLFSELGIKQLTTTTYHKKIEGLQLFNEVTIFALNENLENEKLPHYVKLISLEEKTALLNHAQFVLTDDLHPTTSISSDKTASQLTYTEEGFLKNPEDWSESLAIQMAERDQFPLTHAHWEIIHFARNYYFTYHHIPPLRLFIKALLAELGPEKSNSIYLHQLFPQSPLKLICKYAGIPKPKHCL